MINTALLAALFTIQSFTLTPEMKAEVAGIALSFELTSEHAVLEAIAREDYSFQAKDDIYDVCNFAGFKVYFRRNSSELIVCIVGKAGPPTATPSSNQQILEKARVALTRIRPIQHDRFDFVVYRSGSGGAEEILVDATPIINGRRCDNGVLFNFDARSGALVSLRVDPRRDHSVYRNAPAIGLQSARAAAQEALIRWRPLPFAEEQWAIFRSGIPRAGGTDYASETPQEITNEWAMRRARPYWQFGVRGGGHIQEIAVDAITGSALRIDSYLIMGGKTPAQPALRASESVTVGTKSSRINRAKDPSSVNGLVVPVTVGKALFSARVSLKKHQLFLAEGKSWACYDCDKKLYQHLVANAKKVRRLGMFGEISPKRN